VKEKKSVYQILDVIKNFTGMTTDIHENTSNKISWSPD